MGLAGGAAGAAAAGTGIGGGRDTCRRLRRFTALSALCNWRPPSQLHSVWPLPSAQSASAGRARLSDGAPAGLLGDAERMSASAKRAGIITPLRSVEVANFTFSPMSLPFRRKRAESLPSLDAPPQVRVGFFPPPLTPRSALTEASCPHGGLVPPYLVIVWIKWLALNGFGQLPVAPCQ